MLALEKGIQKCRQNVYIFECFSLTDDGKVTLFEFWVIITTVFLADKKFSIP